MRANDVRSTEPVGHGAYLCFSASAVRRIDATGVAELAHRLGLRNEYQASEESPHATIAYLRRVAAMPGDLADERLSDARAVVHICATTAGPVEKFCAEIALLGKPGPDPAVLAGVVRPMTYTGTAMWNFAYAHRVLPRPGRAVPNAFLLPLRKTTDWWAKEWLERHTYFLPRYDDSGRMVAEGHALASAAGIDCLMRRTYKNPVEPAPVGEYDFLTYFECTDEDIPVFHAVCAALRDTARNPEWTYVSEGPMWHGRRVATWADLLD